MEEWFSTLRSNLMTYTFELKRDRYRQETLDWLQRQETDDLKLEFVAKFINIENGCLPNMLYKTKEWKQNVTIDLYVKIYEEETTQKRAKRIAISFLFSHDYVIPDMIQELMNWMQDDNDWDAFDILHRHSYVLNREQRDLLYEWMQNNRFRVAAAVDIPHERQMESVYNDHQNVHHTEINNSVWKNILILKTEYEEFQISEQDLQEFLQKIQNYSYSKMNSLERIKTDKSFFTRDNISVTLKMVLMYVVSYILQQSQDTQQELLQRLGEELEDMGGTCGSGHLSRLVNCLVGYHPKIFIEISESDRIKASFHQLIQKLVTSQENSDVLLLEMTRSTPNNEFLKFMVENKQTIIQDLGINLELDISIIEESMSNIWNQMYPQLTPNPFIVMPIRQSLFGRIRGILNSYLEFFI